MMKMLRSFVDQARRLSLSLSNIIYTMYIQYTANCEDGDVKLIAGSSATEGYVLMCYNKKWGHICYHYNNMAENNAKTICKQLGYIDGKTITLSKPESESYFPAIIGKVYYTMSKCVYAFL